jgi:hypothetical protein
MAGTTTICATAGARAVGLDEGIKNLFVRNIYKIKLAKY